MINSRAKHFFVISLLGVASLLAIACSSQVPVSTTVGGAQVNGETILPERDGSAEIEDSLNSEEVVATTDQGPDNPAVVAEPATAPRVESIETAAAAEPNITGVAEGDDVQAQVAGRDKSEAAGIVVSGSGRASAAPDLASLRLGVEAIEATVGEARTAAAVAMEGVMASVSEDGVEDKDVQTGYFSIQPRYTGREITRCVDADGDDMKEATAESSVIMEGPAKVDATIEPKAQDCFQEYRSVITGYEVSNNLTVLVRDLETVDDVIDGAVDAGGDNIRFNGLSFSLEDTTELETEARSAAVSNLEAKAAELASLAGVDLGKLVYLTETGGATPPIVRAEFALARAAADSAGSIATPISPGEVSVNVNVVGQYLIDGGE